MSHGYIRIPRSLLRHPAVISAPHAQFRLLMFIIENSCYAPCQQDDHQVLIDVKPGEFMCSERRLAELAGISRNDVQRGIERFSKVKILSQKVIHKRQILTITHSETYNLICRIDEPTKEPKVSQTRAIKEEDKKEKSFKKDKIIPTADAIGLCTAFFSHLKQMKPDFIEPDLNIAAKQIDLMLSQDNRSPEAIRVIISWLPTNSFWKGVILSTKKLRAQFDKLEIVRATDREYACVNANRSFVFQAKSDSPDDLKHMRLTRDFVINDERPGQDLSLKMNPEAFETAFCQIAGVIRYE